MWHRDFSVRTEKIRWNVFPDDMPWKKKQAYSSGPLPAQKSREASPVSETLSLFFIFSKNLIFYIL